MFLLGKTRDLNDLRFICILGSINFLLFLQLLRILSIRNLQGIDNCIYRNTAAC
jgi:hypothetical protein